MKIFNQPNFYVLSGCSGGGKSTLLAALQQRGCLCVEETGRHIVRQQDMIGGNALPWKDSSAMYELILSHNMYNFERMIKETKPVFFDRSIPEALGGDYMLGRELITHHIKAAAVYRYNPKVFILPPWPEIFMTDAERRHGFDEAVKEYEIQCSVYQECGYSLIEVPKVDVAQRAQFIFGYLEQDY